MFPKCEGSHGGVVLSDGLVDADVFKLTKAVFLVYLNECKGLDEEVGDRDGFCSSCDSDAPLSGLEEFLGGRRLVGVEDAPGNDFA